MKTLILSCIICALTVGCATRGYIYEYSFLDSTTNDMTYGDSLIDIAFDFTLDAIHFKLSNKTDHAMTIEWDKIALVQFNQAKRVMHSGVRYAERDRPQAPSVIPPHANLTDMLVPTENVSMLLNRWTTWGLFPQYVKDGSPTDFKGEQFHLYFPITMATETQEYTFRFIVTDVR